MMEGPDPRTLFRLAARALLEGLGEGRASEPELSKLPEVFARPGACFVTLKRDGRLRGCIGSPEAWRPLGQDLAANAFAAAFRDSRFPPLDASELGDLEMDISLLSDPEPVHCGSEEELLTLLRPGEEGWIIEDRGLRALFLPVVWESLPDPAEFLLQLKLKAGLGPGPLSQAFHAHRFGAEEISSREHPEVESFWKDPKSGIIG